MCLGMSMPVRVSVEIRSKCQNFRELPDASVGTEPGSPGRGTRALKPLSQLPNLACVYHCAFLGLDLYFLCFFPPPHTMVCLAHKCMV